MRIRLLVSTLTAAALATTVSGADAATPTLDGKRVKRLTLTAVGAPQDHDANQVTSLVEELADIAEVKSPVTTPDPANCKAPAECSRLTFLYKPARGVRGNLMLTTTWTNPASDIDLYFVEVLRNGSSRELGNCASIGAPSEKLYVPASSLRTGKTYALVAHYFRTVNETVTSKVEIAVPDSTKTTVRSDIDEIADLNCTL